MNQNNTAQDTAEAVVNDSLNISQFTVSQIPYHVHNGSDSPRVNVNELDGIARGVVNLIGTKPIIDCSQGNIFTLTLTSNSTFTISGASTATIFMVEVKQGTGTSYTTTWPAGVIWVTSSGAPIQTTVSNGYTTYGFRALTETTFLGYLVGSN